MRSKLKLYRSFEFISAFFKEQQVINTRGPPVLIGLKQSEIFFQGYFNLLFSGKPFMWMFYCVFVCFHSEFLLAVNNNKLYNFNDLSLDM